MFINLRNALMSENNENVRSRIEGINEGNENLLYRYTTELRKKQFKEGKIDMEKYKKCAITKMQREFKKSLDKKIKEVEKVENNHKYCCSCYSSCRSVDIINVFNSYYRCKEYGF